MPTKTTTASERTEGQATLTASAGLRYPKIERHRFTEEEIRLRAERFDRAWERLFPPQKR